MLSKESIERVIQAALAEVTEEQDRTIPYRGLDTQLWGPGGTLDSLGLVSLILAVEQRLAEDHDVVVTIASEQAMSRSESPFRTVGRLTDYIAELVNGQRPAV